MINKMLWEISHGFKSLTLVRNFSFKEMLTAFLEHEILRDFIVPKIP